MMAGKKSGKKETLLSLLAEETPSESAEVKDCPVISPPHTRTRSEKSKANAKVLSPPNTGNQSPDPNCSICLGKLENKSFTDSCFHMFCFACLLEWSKVKPECPLCKQPFKSIIHNVRSYEDYDQYHIQEAQERPEFPWDSPEGYRFRYRTTVTFDRLMEAHYEEQQRQLRLLQRPTLVTTRRHWRRRRQGATSEFRHRIYLNGMRVKRVTTRQTRQRKTGPIFYRNNPACTHRLVPWLNRELNALLHNHPEHVHFLLELIMDLIKRFEIESDEFFEHVHTYLGRHARHFIHEFTSFARSPYDMIAYDEHAVYEPYTETIESDNESPFSSPGSDIIIVDELVTSEPMGVRSRKRKRTKPSLPSDTHNPEPPQNEQAVSPQVVDARPTALSGWDSPTPGPSGLFASPVISETLSSTVTTTVTTTPTLSSQVALSATEQPSKMQSGNILVAPENATSDSENDSDGSSVVIVKVEKPWDERTPITLSSDSEEERMLQTEISGAQREAESKECKDSSFGSAVSGNTSSDLIDVVTVTIDKSHKKRKHRHHDSKRKSRKRKHSKETNGHSSSSKKYSWDDDVKEHKSSKSSKHSRKRASRKSDYDSRKSRRHESWRMLQSRNHDRREITPPSCVYGYESPVGGKYGEFFQWLQHNELGHDRFPPEELNSVNFVSGHKLSSYSGRRGRYARSRSRSRSYETIWPNSSRSRSPTLSISPNKKARSSDKHSRSRKSRSSSVEIIQVVSSSVGHPSKSHKKHKKHRKHKHKKSKTDTASVGHPIEVVELETEVAGDAGTGEMTEDIQQTNTAAEAQVTPSCSKAPDERKCKKHPTGHKSSKPVKIKRDTVLMRALENSANPDCRTVMESAEEVRGGGGPEPSTSGVCEQVNNCDRSHLAAINSEEKTVPDPGCVIAEVSLHDPAKSSLTKEDTENDLEINGTDEDSVEIDVVTVSDMSLGPATLQKRIDRASASPCKIKTLETLVSAEESLEEEVDVVSVDPPDDSVSKSSNECSMKIDVVSIYPPVDSVSESSNKCSEKIDVVPVDLPGDSISESMKKQSHRMDMMSVDLPDDSVLESVKTCSDNMALVTMVPVGDTIFESEKACSESEDIDITTCDTAGNGVQEMDGESGQEPTCTSSDLCSHSSGPVEVCLDVPLKTLTESDSGSYKDSVGVTDACSSTVADKTTNVPQETSTEHLSGMNETGSILCETKQSNLISETSSVSELKGENTVSVVHLGCSSLENNNVAANNPASVFDSKQSCVETEVVNCADRADSVTHVTKGNESVLLPGLEAFVNREINPSQSPSGNDDNEDGDDTLVKKEMKGCTGTDGVDEVVTAVSSQTEKLIKPRDLPDRSADQEQSSDEKS